MHVQCNVCLTVLRISCPISSAMLNPPKLFICISFNIYFFIKFISLKGGTYEVSCSSVGENPDCNTEITCIIICITNLSIVIGSVCAYFLSNRHAIMNVSAQLQVSLFELFVTRYLCHSHINSICFNSFLLDVSYSF